MARSLREGCCAGCSQRVLVYSWWALNTVRALLSARPHRETTAIERVFLVAGHLCSFRRVGYSQLTTHDRLSGRIHAGRSGTFTMPYLLKNHLSGTAVRRGHRWPGRIVRRHYCLHIRHSHGPCLQFHQLAASHEVRHAWQGLNYLQGCV